MLLCAAFFCSCTGNIGDPSGAAVPSLGVNGASGSSAASGASGSGNGSDGDAGSQDKLVPAPPALSRLTVSQYRNSIADLFGSAVNVPTDLEADTSLKGFTSIGAASVTIAATTAEKYEAAALDVAHQVFGDATQREKLVACKPASAADSCIRDYLASFGKRVWRRPLTGDELDSLAKLVSDVGDSFADPWTGLEYATAALLESPYFLFRVDHGEPDPGDATRRRYGDFEMASRLSYVLWDTTPDDALLAAAGRGELTTRAGLEREAKRLIASPRLRPALVRYFSENLALERLDTLSKDSAVYPDMSPTLPAAMRGELVHAFEHVVFDEDGDVRELIDSPKTFVNAELAKLYGIDVSELDGKSADTFVEVDSAPERRGLLTTAGILATYANTTSTSPTRRGKFVRTRLLCQEIMPPPPGVVTVLPPAEPNQTMRERLELHRTNALCATCHNLMDPIGLALEHFDGIGKFREKDGTAMLDVTGTLDGAAFDGALELASLVRTQPDFGPCIARQLYRFATGHVDDDGEQGVLDALSHDFDASGYRLKALVLALVTSDGFRYAGELD